MRKAIGLLEVKNIAQGIVIADTMLKASNVQLLEASSVCPGKYLIIVAGDIGAVKSSVEAGNNFAPGSVIDKLTIPNMHADIFPALTATCQVEEIKALGIIETYSAASAIMAADATVKAAQVQLIEIRIARGLGGKAVVTFSGDVGAVKLGVEKGSQIVMECGLLVDKQVIPAPHKDLKQKIL